MKILWNLSPLEARAVNNALNEICNGVEIEDWEFETRIGVERTELKRILRELNLILRSEESGTDRVE